MHAEVARLVVGLEQRKPPPRLRLCCRTSSLISGGATAGRSAAAACPSGDRAMHSAASSAVTKEPRCTSLPPRLTFASYKGFWGLGLPGCGASRRSSPWSSRP